MRPFACVVAAGLAAALGGCARPRATAEAETPSCARCHLGAETAAGAHRAHVQALAGAAACGECHPDPRGGSTAHMDGRVDVAFGALATQDATLASSFDRIDRTCSAVYCHGAFEGGNASNEPAWRSGEGGAACGTCHGMPPAATHPGVSSDLAGCVRCHRSTVLPGGELVAGGAHLSGDVEAHDDAWTVATAVGFHGAAAQLGLSQCQGCHGASLGGGRGVACTGCHASGGELACASCHLAVPGDAATRSSHLPGADPGASCRTCHDPAQQADGHYRLPAPGGSFPDASCIACHTGQGETLGGRTPPPLVGWTDVAAGDFHGARAGTGSGGTLAAPYVRGQGPLPCTDCHDQHSSANAFLLRATVNGSAIPAGRISRAGVGAEVLCDACHEGARHASCSGCHASDPKPPGSPCLWCHGHEGILQWTSPDPAITGCDACHYVVQPPVEAVAPRIAPAPTVTGITASGATVRWVTDEGATSYVEYGVSTARHVAGDYALVSQHVVTLAGLAPGTAYVWRVRSSDQFRNVSWSALQTFTTTPEGDVPRPDLAPVTAWATVPSTTAVAGLLWYPVIAPSGTAIEYEVQLAADAAFTSMASADLPAIDPTLATGNSGWIAGTPTTEGSPPRAAVRFDVTLTNLPQDDCGGTGPATYHFRVRARDQTGEVSEWSTPGSFGAMAWDPMCEP